MKKFSLNTIRKSLSVKSKEESEFTESRPDLSSGFPLEPSLYGDSYGEVKVVGANVNNEELKGCKSGGKSEGLMGTLKRRLSTKKQKPKIKASSPSVCFVHDDAFSSASEPVAVLKSQRSSRSTPSHYSLTPWPLRTTNLENNSLIPPSSSSTIQKNFLKNDMFGSEHQIGDLEMDDHLVIGLRAQNFIQYAMPLDDGLFSEGDPAQSYCLDVTSPMDVLPQGECPLHADVDSVTQDLLSPDVFVEPEVNHLILNSVLHAPLLLPPLPVSAFPGFCGSQVPVSVLEHLSFDLNSVPGVQRVCNAMQTSGPTVVTSLTVELKKLARQGWYWGPITRWEAEEKLADLPDGSFLVRDSSDERYLLSLSFRSQGKTLHTRIEHCNGSFSFYEQPDSEGHASIVELIHRSVRDSENGAFCYSRSRMPQSVTYPVRLTSPVSRFMQVRSLQYSCRFVIRQYTRIDLIQKLPLPNRMKDYLQEKHY